MPLTNTRSTYGWVAIALHWISAIGVIALYLLGEQMEDAPDKVAKAAAQGLHVSVGALLFTFLLARIFWSLSQSPPASNERNRWFRIAARVVQGLFLLMIAVLIDWLHGLAEDIHGLATKLFWPLIVLHIGGALKHLLLDRDETVQRILWVRRT